MAFELLTAFFWVIAAGLLGLAISGIFSGWMKTRRRLFLIPYIGLSILFILGFLYWNSIDFIELLLQNWVFGVVAGVIIGILLTRNVLSQPTMDTRQENPSVIDILWLGIGYGVVDALLLNVMPVIAIWNGFDRIGLLSTWHWQAFAAVLCLGASLLVTLLYHVGYSEFRNRTVGLVLVGNTIITLAYIVSTNPLGAIISHTMMHLAAVIKGPERTVQLPPHYSPNGE